jgi:predicted amidohydrolase
MLAAAVQMRSTPDPEHGLARAEHWIGEAARHGAQLIALPETFAMIRDEGDPTPHPLAAPLESHRAVGFVQELARRHRVMIAGGSVPERGPDPQHTYNTAILVDADGTLLASYRKIHLFDVELSGASLRESRGTAPGEKVVTAATRLGRIGLSVCYDVRFPELYRALVDQGAEILLVPSAFTVPTGSAHWEVLLRARAIESQAFVIAAAQWGVHNASRRSWGHSMIIDPWGTILAQVGEGEGIALAELDFAQLRDVRERLPSLRHRRV